MKSFLVEWWRQARRPNFPSPHLLRSFREEDLEYCRYLNAQRGDRG
jgi:hypothetical protein